MNCSTFRKKLYDYMEQSMAFDMKEAMEMHMKQCEACRKIYEEEKELDECFRGAFHINASSFTSSRAVIMKNIDKNRYSPNLFNKLKYNLMRYRINYLATVAVVVLAFFTTPYMLNMSRSKNAPEIASTQDMNRSKSAKDAAPQVRSFVQESGTNEKMAKSESKESTFKAAEAPSADIKMAKDRYIPKFLINPVDPTTDNKFGTAWKISPDGKHEVSINGKGTNAGEEGIGTILINDKPSNNKWTLSLTENEKQFTPKFLEWMNNEELLVIVGYGYGTVSPGGEVFKVNINTGIVELVYGVPSNFEHVVSFKKGKNVLQLQMVIYKDETMNEFKTEERTIAFQME